MIHGALVATNAMFAKPHVSPAIIKEVLDSTVGRVGSLSTKQIKLDLKKGEALLLDEDVAREIELPLKDGSIFTWPVASPQGLLRKYAAASPALQRVLAKEPRTANHPWGIVHYNDEVSPGDTLRPLRS